LRKNRIPVIVEERNQTGGNTVALIALKENQDDTRALVNVITMGVKQKKIS
jgi:hypothetical protein